MCGIAGTFNLTIDKDTFVSGVLCLKHRGPDNTGFYHDELVNLGHTRLSIIDLSDRSNQPMVSSCGDYLIVFNGEIYNYKELRSKFLLNTRTNSDTEVIIELYKKLGKQCLTELNGIFSFAIYDKPRKTLFLARDHVGIKPLYYFKDSSSIVFSSELKAIKAMVKGLKINYDAVAAYLHLGYVPAPMSIYHNIFKLEPGSYLEVKENIFYEDRYWDINNKFSETVVTDVEQAKKNLKHHLYNAISSQLIADVPVGVFLSGGIDSSLVAAIASKTHSQKLNTFSIGFTNQKYNEAIYSRKVAQYLGTNHHEFFVNEKDAIELIPEIIPTYDEPFADSSAIPTMLLSRETKKHVTVTLSGDGGDELFMGYGAYKWARRLDNKAISFFSPALRTLLMLGDNQKKRAARLFDRNQFEPSHIFSQEQYLFSEKELKKLFTKKNNFSAQTFFKSFDRNCQRALSAEEKQALFDWHYYLPDDLLVKVDRASMKYALEVRVPILDINIIKYALNIEKSLKLRGEDSKFILKQVLYEEVPKEFFNRPKHGFSIPLSAWLKKDLKYLIDDLLNKETVQSQNILDYDRVKNLIHKYNSGHDYLYNRIWQLIILNQWIISNA